MLNVAARCHLNGVVHRDMKPEVYAMLINRTSENYSSIIGMTFGLPSTGTLSRVLMSKESFYDWNYAEFLI